jgi:D-glycero-alpha-D-manno-heptose-7-phosphate kinase
MVDEAIDILKGPRSLLDFGKLLDEGWQLKRSLTDKISTPFIDEIYARARRGGAIGGKLIGAGGGGFLMFYAADKTKLRHAMRQTGLTEVRFRFDFEGTKVVIQ